MLLNQTRFFLKSVRPIQILTASNQTWSFAKMMNVALVLAAVFILQTRLESQETSDRTLDRDYEKTEHRIEMRDGKTLHTSVFVPRDQSKKYPIVLKRTPYSCRPYGKDFPNRIGPSTLMEDEKYIFVHQDVRGRWNSQGDYDNMRPHLPGNDPKDKTKIDESSDTFDTIEWLLKNVENNNGKVGMWGISYPGFYTAAALPEAHPAMVAASPQAPISDFYFDDFHHNGAYLQSYWLATATFGYQHFGPTKIQWYNPVQPNSNDGYEFYKEMGPLSNASMYYGENNVFWNQLVEHPHYDDFWKKRSILPHLKNVNCNVLTVGGLFDAEDLYGPLHIYQELEKNNPKIFNAMIMGPWSHGDWARKRKQQIVGNIYFGDDINEAYQRDIEAPFFRHFLKSEGERPNYEAMVFDTGLKEWKSFEVWPPKNAESKELFPQPKERLAWTPPETDEKGNTFTEYLSDPSEPVPYSEDIKIVFTPRKYMTDDQRFAERRPDVIEFVTEPLTDPLTIVGDITAQLKVSTTGTAADWIVKLIDVYPSDEENHESTPPHIQLGGYQQMVRSDVIRGRYRNGFDKPEPFVANQITNVNVPLQDVCHTFKSGHRVMIQIQSTWFPLIDRNPQKYVENIFKAKEDDFIKAFHRVYHSRANASSIKVRILPQPVKEEDLEREIGE